MKLEVAEQDQITLLHTMQIDPLTKMHNRAYLINILQEKLFLAPGEKKFIALLYIEFDDLTRFNDAFGFDIDDQLIVQLNEKVASLINENDILARVGNNQFAIATQNLDSEEDAEVLAKRVIHMLSDPFVIDSNMFYISASIGVSLFPIDTDDAYKLLKTAENTMRHVQKDGTNHIAFTHDKIESSYEESVCLMG